MYAFGNHTRSQSGRNIPEFIDVENPESPRKTPFERQKCREMYWNLWRDIEAGHPRWREKLSETARCDSVYNLANIRRQQSQVPLNPVTVKQEVKKGMGPWYKMCVSIQENAHTIAVGLASIFTITRYR